jgi:large subunit ribosomal protein L32e
MEGSKIKKLLKVRKRINKKRPTFRKIESWRYDRVHGGWNKPKGIDNRSRQKRKSGVKSVNVGYRNPKPIRGYHPSGLIPIVISQLKELEELNPSTHAIIIDAHIGLKKRLGFTEAIQSKKFKILNLGIPYGEEKRIKEKLAAAAEKEKKPEEKDKKVKKAEDKKKKPAAEKKVAKKPTAKKEEKTVKPAEEKKADKKVEKKEPIVEPPKEVEKPAKRVIKKSAVKKEE